MFPLLIYTQKYIFPNLSSTLVVYLNLLLIKKTCNIDKMKVDSMDNITGRNRYFLISENVVLFTLFP